MLLWKKLLIQLRPTKTLSDSMFMPLSTRNMKSKNKTTPFNVTYANCLHIWCYSHITDDIEKHLAMCCDRYLCSGNEQTYSVYITREFRCAAKMLKTSEHSSLFIIAGKCMGYSCAVRGLWHFSSLSYVVWIAEI